LENKSASYTLWGTILAAIITGAIALYIHFDSKTEQQKIHEVEVKADKSKDTANLTITDIYMPPINTKIESSFFVNVANNSLNDAKKLNIKINFGEAEIFRCETQPVNIFKNDQKFDSSIISFNIDNIPKKDNLYIYCLLSQPSFKSIHINGSNLFQTEKYTFEDYKASSTNKDDRPGFYTFLQVVIGLLILWFGIHGAVIISSLLNRKFNL